MIDLTHVRKEKQIQHLFFPTYMTQELRWLLDHANADEYHIKSVRQVLKKQVPSIKHLSQQDRGNEIHALYGNDADFAPSVLLSHYNTEDLFNVLKDILINENSDTDYLEAMKHNTVDISDNIEGISIMERSE